MAKPSYVTKTESEIKTLLPFMRPMVQKVLDEMASLGHVMMCTDGNRTFAEQNQKYAQGRTAAGSIVTKVRGGYSYHNYGVAADCCFVVDGGPSWDGGHDWKLYGKIAKKHGFKWGGDWWNFQDRPHIEISFGYSTAKLLKMGEQNAKALLQELGAAKFPQAPVIPEWAEDSVKDAIQLGIEDWSDPNIAVDRALLAYIFSDLGIITKMQVDKDGRPYITKAQMIHGMKRAGILRKYN